MMIGARDSNVNDTEQADSLIPFASGSRHFAALPHMQNPASPAVLQTAISLEYS
jgi:hypothetical protein